jgi:hypothetical protein
MLGNTSTPPGIDQQHHSQSQDAPPPYQYSAQTGRNTVTNPVTAPHQLQENLLNAIKKSRAHNSSGLFSRGETNIVPETKSYCDEHPAHDLTFVADIKYGIQMFMTSSSGNSADRSAFLREHSVGLIRFATLLKSIAEVFSLDTRTLNIFQETAGKTIAFNRNGSLFCNYRYYAELHEKTATTSHEGFADAFVYWWVTLCHELAHNLVADHSSNHSYYTEGFVSQYFGRAVKMIGKAEQVLKERQQQSQQQQDEDPAERLVDV